MKLSLVPCLICLGLCLAQQQLEDKCDKLGGPGTYEKLKVASEKSKTCIYEFFGIATFNYEAKATEKLDTITSNNGNSVKDVGFCLKDYVEVAKLCLTREERKSFITVAETLRKGVNDVYENDKQGIVEFMEKGGIECVKSRIGGIMKCYSDYPFCKEFDKFKSCTVQDLQDNCPSTVSVNIAEELLQSVRSSVCTNNKIIRSRRSMRRIVRDSSGMQRHLPHIKNAVKKRCLLFSQMTEAQLDERLHKMEKCIEEKTLFLTPRAEFVAHMNICTTETRKMFTDCLPQKLKYLPEFFYELAVSLVNLVYDDFYEIGDGLGPCVDKLKTTESKQKYHECATKVGGEEFAEVPTSKAKFCQKLIPLSKCFVAQINETCVHNEDLDKFTKDYIEAMEKPCNS